MLLYAGFKLLQCAAEWNGISQSSDGVNVAGSSEFWGDDTDYE